MVHLISTFYSKYCLFSLMQNFSYLKYLYFSFKGSKYSFLDIFFMETFINLTYLQCCIYFVIPLDLRAIKFLNFQIILNFLRIFMIMIEALPYYIIMMVSHYHIPLVLVRILKDFISHMNNLVKIYFHFYFIMFIFRTSLI